MSQTGTQIITASLRELGVLDPIQAASSEHVADGIAVGSDLIDSWRTDGLTIGGATISTYSLVSGTASYTIGDGGDFDQGYPTSIPSWSVIPDDDAADPLELPMGRPYTDDEWQGIRIKTQTGPRPSAMYFDRAYAAGLGNCLFHPIPDNGDVDVKIYSVVPDITSLVAATTYDLRSGYMRALKLNLALELRGRYPRPIDNKLEKRAAEALGFLRISNVRPKQSSRRPEFAIGNQAGRRTFNVYQGS